MKQKLRLRPNKCLGLKIRWPKPKSKDRKLWLRPINGIIGGQLQYIQICESAKYFYKSLHCIYRVSWGTAIYWISQVKSQIVEVSALRKVDTFSNLISSNLSVAQLVTTVIFFLVWDKSRIKCNNSQNSTQKMRTSNELNIK